METKKDVGSIIDEKKVLLQMWEASSTKKNVLPQM